MKIRELMRVGPFTIRDTDALGTAYRAMMRSRIRHLPVIGEDGLVGIVSERDLLAARANAASDREWWKLPVRDSLVSPVLTADPDDDVDTVAARMASSRIGSMPIVKDGVVIGIVTATDLLSVGGRAAATPVTTRLTAADAMTPWPFTTTPQTRLVEAVRRMVDHHVRHLPVLEAATIVGMLSERDVRTAIGDPMAFLEAQGPSPWVVETVMSRPVSAVVFDRPLAEVARVFATGDVGAVPVTDKFGALIGIVSYVDVLRVVAA